MLDPNQLSALAGKVQSAQQALASARTAQQSTSAALAQANADLTNDTNAIRDAHQARVKPAHDADTAAQTAIQTAQKALQDAKDALDAYLAGPTPATPQA